MSIQQLLDKIIHQPTQVDFNEVIDTITLHYHYTPSRFSNGHKHDLIINPAGSNQGACKIFAFAKLNHLTEQQTLHCFGDHYRQEVLLHPEGDDHANIRHFMRHGWAGIQFEPVPLIAKQ